MLLINTNLIFIFNSIILVITLFCTYKINHEKFNYKCFLEIIIMGNKMIVYLIILTLFGHFINNIIFTEPLIEIYPMFIGEIILLLWNLLTAVVTLHEEEYFQSKYTVDSKIPNVAKLSYEPIICELKNYLPESIIKNIVNEYINLYIPHKEFKNNFYNYNIILNDKVYELEKNYLYKLNCVNRRLIPYNVVIGNDYEYMYDEYKFVRLNKKFRIIKFLSKNNLLLKFLQILCYSFSKSYALNFKIINATASNSYVCFLHYPNTFQSPTDPACVTFFSHSFKKLLNIRFNAYNFIQFLKLDSHEDRFLILIRSMRESDQKLLKIIIIEVKNKLILVSQYVEENFYTCENFKIFDDRIFFCCYNAGIYMRTIKTILKNKKICNLSYEFTFF